MEHLSEPAGSGQRPDRSALYRLAYEAGQRTLDDQRDELNGVRTRASQFLAFVGSATAFLVGTSLGGTPNRSDAFYALAIVASAFSVVTVIAVCFVLYPRHRVNLRLSGRALVEQWIESEVPRPTESELLRALATKTDDMRQINDSALVSLRRGYLCVIIAGSLAVLLWAALAWAVG